MKIPSEAELIEMEQRAAMLPGIQAYLEGQTETLRAKLSCAGLDYSRRFAELERVSRSVEAIEGLVSDLEMLIGLARAWGVNAR